MHKCHAWVSSVNRFIDKLESFVAYQDLVTSPVVSLKGLQNGFLILLNKLKRKMLTMQFYARGRTPATYLDPAEFSVRLFNTPRSVPIEAFGMLTETRMFNTARYLAQTHNTRLLNLPHQLLISSLQYLQNHFGRDLNVQCMANKKSEAVKHFRSLMGAFYQLWCNKKQTELEEEARKASLYKYKSQVHCEDKSDEDVSQELQKELFPSYDNDYDDLLPKDLLNDIPKIPPSKADHNKEESEHQVIPIVNEHLVYQSMKAIFMKSKDMVGIDNLMMEAYQQIWLLMEIPEVVYGMSILSFKFSQYIIIMRTDFFDSFTQ